MPPTQQMETAIASYPTGPILQFPPLPPSTGGSLRRRCPNDVPLSIVTSFSRNPRNSTKWPQKGHVQPQRDHLPRRRTGQELNSYYNEEPGLGMQEKRVDETTIRKPDIPAVVELTPTVEAKQDNQFLPPIPSKDHAVEELFPSLFVGFSSPTTSLPLDDGTYTHVVQIVCHSATVDQSQSSKNAIKQSYNGRVQRLCLTLPYIVQSQAQRAGLALSDAQLRASRDFISEALLYSHVLWGRPTDVRVMIASPFGHPADAMCVVGCYVAFALGKRVSEVFRCVDEEEKFLNVWKGKVSEDEVERTEKAARTWSWLSNVVRILENSRSETYRAPL